MNCKNCGNMLQPGAMVCPYCNTPVNGQPMGQPMGAPMGQPVMQQAYVAPPKKRHTVLWVILGIIGAILVAALVLIFTSKKLKCSYNGGSFTVYYTSSQIWACMAEGDASCDLDKLQENAKTYGVDTLINAIESEAKAAGAVCTRK